MTLAAFIALLEKNIDGVISGSLRPETVLASLSQWDSLAVLTVIAMVEESNGVRLRGVEITACATVADLYALMRSKGA